MARPKAGVVIKNELEKKWGFQIFCACVEPSKTDMFLTPDTDRRK